MIKIPSIENFDAPKGDPMDTEILKTMITLAETKSFSKTAEIMNVVQSTVSARIADLEASIGQKIFIRTNQHVTLTEAGLIFLPYARHMVNDMENAICRLNSSDFFDDRFVIGNVYSAMPNFLLPVYIRYMKNYPRVSLKAICGHSTDILQRLVEGLIDIAITYQIPQNRRVSSWICLEEDFVLVAPPGHPLAKKGSCSVSDLPNENLLFHNWSGPYTEWIGQVFPGTRYYHATIGNPNFLLSLVEAGIGPAILTRSTVAPSLAAGRVVEIPLTGFPMPPRWRTYISARPNQLSRKPIRDWIDTMAECGLPLISMQ